MSDEVTLVIKIPKWFYEETKEFQHPTLIDKAIMDGTPLSEHIGEWIPKERTTECSIDIDIVCSECGYVGIEGYAHGYELNELPVQEMKDYIKKLDMNYCPCCGAKMEGGE